MPLFTHFECSSCMMEASLQVFVKLNHHPHQTNSVVFGSFVFSCRVASCLWTCGTIVQNWIYVHRRLVTDWTAVMTSLKFPYIPSIINHLQTIWNNWVDKSLGNALCWLIMDRVKMLPCYLPNSLFFPRCMQEDAGVFSFGGWQKAWEHLHPVY